MPRPTPAQICYGTLAVVVATVALLAASGTSGVLGVTVLVVAGLALGTLATALAVTAPARRRARAQAGGRVVAGNGAPSARHTAGAGVPAQRADGAERRLASWGARR